MLSRLFLYDLEIFSVLLMPLLLLVSVLLCSLFLLGAIAFSTVFERKTIAILQNRRGPNRAGWFGLLQAIGDGVKLVTKAQVSKKQQSPSSYFFAPFAALFLSWFMAYFMLFASFDDFSLYFLLIWTSLNVYSLPLAGIVTSRSRFALLGGIRSFAQLLSYELGLSVIFLTIVVYTGTPILGGVMEFQVSHESLFYSMLPVFLIWFVIILAETNRVPFDLPEAEAELVAGFATEYSSFAFAAFFLAEYGSMLIYSYLTALLFFYPISPSLLTVFFFFVFVWARTTLPRYKVDQLLWIGWYCFIPLTLVLYVVYYFRFNFIGFFTGSLFSFIGIGSTSISNRYNVVNKKAFMLLQKKGELDNLKIISRKVWIFGVDFFKDLGRLIEFISHKYLKEVPEKPVPSKTWLVLPIFNVFFSYFQLLSCAHGVYTFSLLNI